MSAITAGWARQAASALTLAIGLTCAATADAQQKKIVPFLTAESSPESVAQLLALIKEFEAANPGIGIELQLTSNDNRASRIINSVAVGDELGIFEIERRLVPDFTAAGYLLPLDSIVDNIGIENFIPGSLLYWPWDGHLYQFTSDLSAGTLYWRKDLFEAAGLGEPDSFERLLEASEKLDGQNGVSGNAFESSNRGNVQRFVTFLWQNCGDFYNRDGTLAFDRPGARQAVEDYAALNAFAPSGNHSWGSLDAINSFVAGRVAMALFPGRLGFQVANNAPEIARVTGNREARVARGGQGPRVVYGAVTSYAIGSTVRHPEEAKMFLEFLFSGDRLLNYAMAVPGHIAPAIKDVQARLLEQDTPYIRDYRAWVETILEATTYFNAEAQNMGSITEDCEFKKSLVPMPWASRVMVGEPVTSRMFQEIALIDRPVEEAYAAAVDAHRVAMEEWKAENAWFTPPDPNWVPPGMQ
ncbi:MAG: extracellular solute-binding protein [Rhodobacteraceae bacterium]|jgi:ABC-type glycerol-3-phosphate transport system substrate-binding protein|nr:extracellular solute-binding protein [Paracoccaceae bacterium]